MLPRPLDFACVIMVVFAMPCAAITAAPQAIEEEGAQEFSFFDELITVPVMVEGRKWIFLIDFTTPVTTISKTHEHELTSIPDQKGIPGKRRRFVSPRFIYKGSSLVSPNYVECVDMKDIVHTTVMQIDGILGMDVFQHCTVQIDSSRGLLRILSGAHKDNRKNAVPMEMQVDKSGIPSLRIMCGNVPQDAVIELSYWQSLAVKADCLQELYDAKVAGHNKSVRILGMDDNGKLTLVPEYRLARLEFGPNKHENFVCVPDHRTWAGCGFVSRYDWTFIFPEQKVYVAPSSYWSCVDRSDCYGLKMLGTGSGLYVIGVDEGHGAAKAGIRVRDTIVKMNGVDARRWPSDAVEKRLCLCRVEPLQLTIQRNDQEIVIELPP